MDKQGVGSIIPAQGNVFRDFVLRSKLILNLLVDGRVNILLKLLPVGALAYLISPVDFIPNALMPILGTVDDIAIVWLGMYLFLEMCPPGIVREHLKNLLGADSLAAEDPKTADDDSDVIDGEVTDIK